jgi:hypothetical protein
MAERRDVQTEEFVNQPLPRPVTPPETPVDLAVVFTDGGRMRTRDPGQGRGVHNPHWRETKNAAFHRMSSESFETDPQAELPDCFRNQAYVEKLIHGLKGQKKQGREEMVWPSEALPEIEISPDDTESWQPKSVFRTCLSSLASSDEFGPMMAAAADARGFFTAGKKAFVGDGQSYNWSIQQRWFPGFEPIVDFVHVVEYVYEAAKAIATDAAARWEQYLAWTTACWQGRVTAVIDDLLDWQARQPPVPVEGGVADTEPRHIVATTTTYLQNNGRRMDYPRYRSEGLPVTSSLAESLVKQISKRVKGTEMFWDDGASGEAILQLRAALVSDGTPMADFLATRPITPFAPRCRSGPLATAC